MFNVLTVTLLIKNNRENLIYIKEICQEVRTESQIF